MSEYAAAVGLAALAQWPQTRDRWINVAARYWAALDESGRFHSPAKNEVTASLVVDLGVPHGPIARAMQREGIDTRNWYGLGCHREPAFAQCTTGALPATDKIATTTLGLPFFLGITESEIAEVAEVLAASVGIR